MSHAKKISVLNTLVKYFYQRIIGANYNADQYCNSLIWPSNFYNRCSKPKAVTRRCLVKKVLLKILQNSQKNTCLRPSLEIWSRDFNTDVFLWNDEIFKNNFFYRKSPVAASTSRDATFTCKCLVDVWAWGKVQSGYFGMYATVTLFSREQCHWKYMEEKIHESDEHALFLEAVFLQYLQSFLLYKSKSNQ